MVAEPIESAIPLICAFGLTVNQAKIYLAVAYSKADTVKAISKISNIPSESIYRTMPALELMDLVHRVLSTPVKYQAIPIQEAIELLKARDKKERDDLYIKANHLTKNLLMNLPANPSEESEVDTTIIIGYDAWVRKLGCAVSNANKSFQGITYAESFRQGMFNNGKSYEKCLQRGVECHHIVHQIGKKELHLLGDSHLQKNPLWKRKYTFTSLLNFAVIDRKELLISLTPTELGKKHRAMCTTNPGLVTLALNYFETLWNTASK